MVEPALALVGLMTVPAPGLAEVETRSVYRRLRALHDTLGQRYPSPEWQHLSMGMTEDFEVAIEEGATIVRIGRAIFGDRP
jgi:PLP dependent protein